MIKKRLAYASFFSVSKYSISCSPVVGASIARPKPVIIYVNNLAISPEYQRNTIYYPQI